jgi:hypothetical protein
MLPHPRQPRPARSGHRPGLCPLLQGGDYTPAPRRRSSQAHGVSWAQDLATYARPQGGSPSAVQRLRARLVSAVQAAPESPDAWWALLQMEDSQLAGSTGALDRAARGGVVLMDLYRWATKLCPRQSNARSEAFVKLWLGFARQQWCAGAEKAGRGPRVPAGPPPR